MDMLPSLVRCRRHEPWYCSSPCSKQAAPRRPRRCAPGLRRPDAAASGPGPATASKAAVGAPRPTPPRAVDVAPPGGSKKKSGGLDYSKFNAIEDSDDERPVPKQQNVALPLGMPQDAVPREEFEEVWRTLLRTKNLPVTPAPDLEAMWGYYKFGGMDERALLDQACEFLAKLPCRLGSEEWKAKTYTLTKKMETECREDEARMWSLIHMCRFPADGDAYYNQGVLLSKMADRAKFGGALSVRLPSLEGGSKLVSVEQYCTTFTRAAASHYRRCLKVCPKHRAAHINLIGCLERNEPSGWYEEVHEVAAAGVRNGVWYDRWQRPPHFVPTLSAKPWHDPEEYPMCRALRENYPTIRREYDAYIERLVNRKDWDDSDTTPGFGDVGSRAGALHDGGLRKSGRWREVPLFTNGALQSEYAAQFPETVRLLQTYGLDAAGLALCLGGDIIFSVLSPGTRLRPHCGPSNARLTCHLGIIVPRSASQGCRLRVASEPPRGWEEGRCIVFDDSFEHEVIYDEAGPHEAYPGDRVVLLANFWHPGFAFKNDPEWRVKSDKALAAIDIESLPQTAVATMAAPLRVEQGPAA